jgi:ATP-dependent helicase/nuclease subunit A
VTQPERRPPQDQAERDRIRRDIDRTLFVEAGAGTGKTSELVGRVVALVMTAGIPLHHIAAVTFTEKAAAELRDRLRVELEAADALGDEARQRRDEALDDLDAAAIGTLHSFAQRILSQHPIEAGLPPLVEILDEVSSEVAFERRWIQIRDQLLDSDDPHVRAALLIHLSSDASLNKLRSLARILEQSWDLITDRVLRHDDTRIPEPDLDGYVMRARMLASRADDCTDAADKFLGRLQVLRAWSDRAAAAIDSAERIQLLHDASRLSLAHGQAKNWNDLAGLRGDCKTLLDDISNEHGRVLDRVTRLLTRTVAAYVLEGAAARRAEGRLDFHDLLVLSRDLLRNHADVRARLQSRYRRILLDEFQDTDPIQIELALRIAGGAAAEAADWRDISVPDGSVFVVGDPKQSIYRFRRADIATYLQAEQHLGGRVDLITNFRSSPTVLATINGIFEYLIQPVPESQPAYAALMPHRDDPTGGSRVLGLGVVPHIDEPNADELRVREAIDVAESIRTAIAERWQVWNTRVGEGGGWRDVRLGDIAILVPARTSLPALEGALERAGIPYRAEASSLVYRTAEVRDLLLAARAIDDPSDELAIVSTLRSSLFGIGDDELWAWRNGGGRWSPFGRAPEALAEHPVAAALDWMRGVIRRAGSMSPSEVLTELVVDRRMYEVASGGLRGRDVWRRLRFVVDQARSWSEAEHGGLRSYLEWAARQGEETARVSEAVLPERDLDAVRILTIHSAKGLEFPVVILSGMTTARRVNYGVNLLWTKDNYAVRIGRGVETTDYDIAQPLDEQLSDYERLRLLYVAFTRARDHLVVSLHRKLRASAAAGQGSSAEIVHEAWDGFGPIDELVPMDTATPVRPPAPITPAPDWATWLSEMTRVRAASRRSPAVTASGLEGTAPNLPPDAGLAKGARTLELPAWTKGRYGSEVGRAVHAVLQHIDLATGDGLDEAAAAHAVAEEVPDVALVAALARAALTSPTIQAAAGSTHWRETYVGTTVGDLIVEGFIDLVYLGSDGLVIVDYKTDAVPGPAIESRVALYRPQMAAYAKALSDATGEAVVGAVLVFLHPEGAVDRLLGADELAALDLAELAGLVGGLA